MQVVEKAPSLALGVKLPENTQILFRFWPEGWMRGTVLGRSGKRGCNYRVEFTDGETLDSRLYEEDYAYGANLPPRRVGVWCRLKKIDE